MQTPSARASDSLGGVTPCSRPSYRGRRLTISLLAFLVGVTLTGFVEAAPRISAYKWGSGNVRISWRRSSQIRKVEVFEGNRRRHRFLKRETRRNYVKLYNQRPGTHYYFARFHYRNGRTEDSRVKRVSISGIDSVTSDGYRLRRTIDGFNVQGNGRYLPRNGKTYCNVFAADVAARLGIQLPNGSKKWKDGRYYTANMQYKWLQSRDGRNAGWRRVSDRKAQEMANEGKFAVAVWYNHRRGQSGHIAVVKPYAWRGRYRSNKGTRIAQAGARNYNDTVVRTGFGRTSSVLYYVNGR